MKNSTVRLLILITSIFSYFISLLTLIAFVSESYLFIFLFQIMLNILSIIQLSLLIKEKNLTRKNLVLLKKPKNFS